MLEYLKNIILFLLKSLKKNDKINGVSNEYIAENQRNYT